jgi:aminomethyltransferase
LRDAHAGWGATFGHVGDWNLPTFYTNRDTECAVLRNSAAAFDGSHRSRFLLSGTDAVTILSTVFGGLVGELEEGRAVRAAALRPDGTIADLALIARTGGIAYTVVGEPGQRFETYARLQAAAPADFDARIDDRSESTCLIGIAGPQAADVAREHLSEGLPARLQSLHCVAFEFHGFRSLAVRTSATGEDGFELVLAPAVAQHLLDTLRAAGVALVGSEALDVARLEAAIPAFDPDLTPGLTPAEADLDLLLGLEGGAAARMLAGLLLDGPPVAPGTLVHLGGAEIGEVRSCLRSPTLNSTIALGIIESRHAFPGVSVRIGAAEGTIVAKPFYRRRTNPHG